MEKFMIRKVFFSFHYKRDNWRAAQVRNIGVIEGNKTVSDNKWETIAGRGDAAIKRWINKQMRDKSCVVVLIGHKTASRKWIKYEIKKAWKNGKGVVGIYIHNLKDKDEKKALKGKNPFKKVRIKGCNLSHIVEVYNPPYKRSKKVYNYIEDNIEDWVEEAIRIRKQF